MAKKAPTPVPDGMHTITPHLWFNGKGIEAVEYYKKAFGAELAGPLAKAADGKSLMHAMVKIGDSQIMMADAWAGQWEQAPDGSSTMGLWLYVDDCDALMQRAVDAGCNVICEMMDAFWGDRMGKVKDPYGHCWAIATHKWDYTPEEMAKGEAEFMEKCTQTTA